MEANGEEILLENGEKFSPARGSLIQIAEWYGAKDYITRTGLRLSANEVSLGILSREHKMIEQGWLQSKPLPGPADNSINASIEKETASIGLKMSEVGVSWLKSDKSPGSRINGLQLFRDRLEAAVRGEGPAIYFMNNCLASIAQLPKLPLSDKIEGDVHEKAVDHVYDMVRYRVLHRRKQIATDLDVGFPV